ncbi:MAG: aspartate aminotransferase family protein [Candidatus Hodarchaeota archaeon]
MTKENDEKPKDDMYSIPFFARRPLEIVRGEGAIVYDREGTPYIDCLGGHGVAIVGHSHPKIVQAICNQTKRLIVCSNALHNDVRGELFELLASIVPSPLSLSFLSNSGTEAVECALKIARKATGRTQIIAAKNSFHGRTMGALTATWNPKYRKPFEPLIPDFHHIKFGNEEELENITEKTAAVILEPIQGESGVFVAPEGYLKKVKDQCSEKGTLLILDEVQTGMGRTGKMFAFQHWGVIPDILCLGKGIAGGFPMGATITSEEIANKMGTLEHGSTFGGNPLASAAAIAAIKVITEEKLPERAAKLGSWFMEKLNELGKNLVREIRGKGLMIGIDLRFKAEEYVLKAMKKQVLLLTAGITTLRMLPPLIIQKEQLERVLEVLDEILEIRKA